MRTAIEAIHTALTAHSQYCLAKNFCYIYGAKGTRINSRVDVEYFFKAEPAYFARYSAEEKEQIIRNSIGKIAYDCSGFVGWLCTGDHQYSAGQITNAHNIKTTAEGFAANPAGSILFTTYGGRGRHIGIDVDHGFCCDMAYESTDANIAAGKAGVRFYPIIGGQTAWEKSGLSNVLQY